MTNANPPGDARLLLEQINARLLQWIALSECENATDMICDISDQIEAFLQAVPAQPMECVGCEDGINAKTQDRILELLNHLTGVEPGQIDGSGCDSGDPVDLTLSEISQAFEYLEDQHEQAVPAPSPDAIRLDSAVAFLEALQARGCYLHDAHGAVVVESFIAIVVAALDDMMKRPVSDPGGSTEAL